MSGLTARTVALLPSDVLDFARPPRIFHFGGATGRAVLVPSAPAWFGGQTPVVPSQAPERLVEGDSMAPSTGPPEYLFERKRGSRGVVLSHQPRTPNRVPRARVVTPVALFKRGLNEAKVLSLVSLGDAIVVGGRRRVTKARWTTTLLRALARMPGERVVSGGKDGPD